MSKPSRSLSGYWLVTTVNPDVPLPYRTKLRRPRVVWRVTYAVFLSVILALLWLAQQSMPINPNMLKNLMHSQTLQAKDAIDASIAKQIYEQRFSIIVSTYDRYEHLLQFLDTLANAQIPDLHAVYVAWGLGAVLPPESLSLESYKIPVHLVPAKADSLNERFRVGLDIPTKAALYLDDDIELSVYAITSGWEAWKAFGQQEHRIVGYTPRRHVHFRNGGHLYTYDTREGYSMILTSSAFIDRTMLEWFWSQDAQTVKARMHVDRHLNCEDILMNYVISQRTGLSPLLVTVGTGGMKAVDSNKGISSKSTHFSERSYCLSRFHNLFGDVLKMSRVSVGKAKKQRILRTALHITHNPPNGTSWVADKKFKASS